ncbi:LysR family transcriptional regulator [Geodermatophilus sp. SYSU D00710]
MQRPGGLPRAARAGRSGTPGRSRRGGRGRSGAHGISWGRAGRGSSAHGQPAAAPRRGRKGCWTATRVRRSINPRRGRWCGTDVELRHLRYVVAVADDLSFTRAAARLHVDQPSLSRQIRAVERALGVDLFTRTTRSVRLTTAGEEFVRSARQALAEVDRGMEAARRAGGADGGTVLRLGYLVPLRDQMMMRLVREVEAAVPALRLGLAQYDYATPDAGLGAGDVDLGIVNLPLSTAGLDSEPLLTEPRVVVVAADHPLAARDAVRLADLEAQQDLLWAVPPAGDPLWRAYWAAGDHRGGRLPERRCEPRNPDEYAHLVATGRAFGLNLRAAAEPFAGYGMASVPVVDLDPVTIHVAWRRHDPPPHLPAIRTVVRRLRTAGGR